MFKGATCQNPTGSPHNSTVRTATTAQDMSGSGGPVAESLGPRRFTRRIGLVEMSVCELRGFR
jgi:hypothetical protein